MFSFDDSTECDMRNGAAKKGISQTGENSMRLLLGITMFLFTTPVAWAASYPPHVPAAVLEEFTSVEAIKFRDAHGTGTSPSIPKSWKLISVSEGEKTNSSKLWFQDSDGSIYLLQGFTAQNKFFILDNMYKIPAK
jgi:hypothetical protein